MGAYGAASGGGSRTEWLESTLEWSGLLLTPNAHDYFRLRARRTAPGTLTTHACLSTSTHPKEVLSIIQFCLILIIELTSYKYYCLTNLFFFLFELYICVNR